MNQWQVKDIIQNTLNHLKVLIVKKKQRNDDNVDTNVELDSNTEQKNITEIIESPMNNGGLETVVFQYIENTELITSE